MHSDSDTFFLCKQEEEWAFLHGCGIGQRRLVELAVVPELQPLEIVWTHLNIVVHPTMLEEELLVTPVRADGVRATHKPTDQAILAAELGRLIEREHLEHARVDWDDRHLVLKVVLILVGPTENIIRLDIQLIWPVRVLLLATVLVELGNFHHRCASNVVCHCS